MFNRANESVSFGLLRYLIIPLAFVFYAHDAHAGRDPIGWTQVGSIPATTTINHSYAVSFTLTNNLPFTMPTGLYVQNGSTPSSDVTVSDGCEGVKLASGGTCTVGLIFIPKSAGSKTIGVYMEYGNNKVHIPNPLITSTASSGSSSSTGIEGTVMVPFPTSIKPNTEYTLSYKFTNNGSSTVTGLSLSQDSDNSSTYTQSATDCGASLAANASCTARGSFTTTATSGPVKVGYTYTNGTLTATATSAAIVNNSAAKTQRSFTFTNNCTQTVYFGFVGGAVNSNPCKSSNDCAHGSFCDPAANKGAGECFYHNPVPKDGYQLTNGQSRTVNVTDYGLQFVWSGNMAARTGTNCGTGTCTTADCGSGTGNKACPVGGGFAQPASLAEITMLRDSIDSYDVSILNGYNVAIQITPTTDFTFNPSGFSPSEYNCTSPGKVSQSNGLGNCTWSFTPPANFPSTGSAYKYKYVTPESPQPSGGLGCTSDTPCTTPGTVCGLYHDTSVSPTTLNSYCGTLIGYNTANQVCSFANTNLNPPTGSTATNLGDPYFDCDSALPSPISNFTYWGLFACKAQADGTLGTCYNTSANPPESTTNCCGCVNWQSVGGGIVVPSSTTTCVKSNTSWTSLVQPGIEWFKLACPTAYVYPFDDKASSFGCDDISSTHTVNTVSYTITFCPS